VGGDRARESKVDNRMIRTQDIHWSTDVYILTAVHCQKSSFILIEQVNLVAIGKHALYNARAFRIEVMLLFDWIHPMAFLLPK